jgi:hypothetical protein
MQCHEGSRDPHGKESVRLGCADCHGGDPTSLDINCAHVRSANSDAWPTSANPVRSYTLLNHESPDFIRFVNPGDLRVAHISCGMSGCHAQETLHVKKSMMTHGCMLWGAALYNNGAVPNKRPRFGESYSMLGSPQRLVTIPPPTDYEMAKKGVLPFLDPLPRFEMSQPGNILRIFERGGRFAIETGIPESGEEPGRPRARLSNRGLGTLNRTDPVFVGLQKTRLLDPTLNFLGTNDHPGDYRSSGCTACHMVYANDRSPVHSGPYAKYGNLGQAATKPDDIVRTVDPTIPKHESGHPIHHAFTRAIPTSQCIVCHVHPGTNVMNSYLGFMWWDEETDGDQMYPKNQKYPTAEEFSQAQQSNPDEAAARGLWSDSKFLDNVSHLNSRLKKTQFADFHGHGWVFRAVFKKDRQGKLLDYEGDAIENVTTDKLVAAMKPPTSEERKHGKQRDDTPVHLMDVHLERGMHCVDCHFVQDSHGDSKLYGEVRAAIEIQCIDCHGTVTQPANLRTTGPAASDGPDGKPGRDLSLLRTPSGKRRFERRGGKLIQNSMVEPDLSWVVTQTRDTVNPSSEFYNALSALAKTVRFESESSNQIVYGLDSTFDDKHCAHADRNMSCIACHSSWNPSCFGCHLPQKANKKLPQLHNEGDLSRNFTSYNFQTLRDDVFMLGRDGDVTGNRIGPVRSACAIHVGSYNQNRESIYVQQQTISGEGLSGIAFSSNVPHTVRAGRPRIPGSKMKDRGSQVDDSTNSPSSILHPPFSPYRAGTAETKLCSDCHVSKDNDNNAIMAQLLMQGTNYVNFIGRYCWVAAGDHGLEGVVVTERDEPQAVIGSSLHKLAFPDNYRDHVRHHEELEHAHEHPGRDVSDRLLHPKRKPEILSLQHRGEFLYAACGTGGLRVFDIAFIDDKAFSERITTAPVSPIGQRFYVPTKFATSVAAPTTIAPDPTRTHREENRESAVHGVYAYLYVTDWYEGLILVGAGSLLDGNPTNNFLERAVTFNPDGLLCGARSVTIVGTYAYVCCSAGLVVVDLTDPARPTVSSVIGNGFLHGARACQVQFRYGFVCDEEGIKVLDTTHPSHPQPILGMALAEAHNIYLARTYAYVAAGSQGLVILDITNPEQPKIDQIFDADGCMNDVHDVKLGITYVSEFAYVADGKNGLRVVQLTSPDTPGNDGFSPRPTPRLIATRKLPNGGHALAVAKGVDRDRAVDESGNQIGVFGRIGARPLNLQEQHRMYYRNGEVWRVSDDPSDARYRQLPAR